MSSPSRSGGNIATMVVILLILCALFITYLPLLRDWYEFLSEDPTYSYGLLVPAVSLYLAFRDKRRLKRLFQLKAKPLCAGGCVLVISGVLLYMVGEISTVLFVSRLSFLVVLVGVLVMLFGYSVVKDFAFPLGFLLFALPLPAVVYLPLSTRLQLISSALAGKVLDLIGVPALREGNLITLPNSQLDIVQACSGIHSLFALTAISILCGYLLFTRLSYRFLFALCGIVVAILFNGLRITALGVLSYHFGPVASESFAHYTTGSVTFAVGAAAILVLGRLFSGANQESRQGYALPSLVSDESVGVPSRSISKWVLSVTCLVAFLPIVILRTNLHPDRPVPLKRPFSDFPRVLADFVGDDLQLPPNQVVSLGADDIMIRRYRSRNGGVPVTLYLAYYQRQREGSAMHSPMHCIPGAGWEVEDRKVLTLHPTSQQAIQANKITFSRDGSRMLVLYFYVQQGSAEPNELTGAFSTLWHAIVDRRTDGCLIRFSAPIITSEKDTLNQELRLASKALPLLLADFLPPAPREIRQWKEIDTNGQFGSAM